MIDEQEVKKALDKAIKAGLLKMVLKNGEWCYVKN